MLTTVSSGVTVVAQNLDTRILLEMQANRQPDLDQFSIACSNSIYYAVIGTPTIFLVDGLARGKSKSKQVFTALVLGTTLNYALVKVGKSITDRPRPFVIDPRLLPIQGSEGSSFPSGHTATAFNLATTMSINYPHWYVAVPIYSWAALVGASRMYNGVHYPSDVAAGAVLGVASAIATHYCCKQLFKSKKIRPLVE